MRINKLRHGVFAFFLAVCCVLTLYDYAYPQAGVNNAGGIVCAASGSSTLLLAANSSRMSYSINNDSGVDVRVSFVSSGTPNLTDANSTILKANQPTSDSLPGAYYGRIVCMSTTGVTATVHYTEASR